VQNAFMLRFAAETAHGLAAGGWRLAVLLL